VTGDTLTRTERLLRSMTPERIVAGVIAAMVVAVTAATAVGFWLSYGGLHDFAVTAGGLTGPEAWAWPASVDLFIVAGEAGVTISALRHRRDLMAWGYLLVGFAASVTGNVLHVHPGYLPWAKYAVAAVPPVAAMLALAALLRHVYRLALDAHLATAPPAAPRESSWRKLWMARKTRPVVVGGPGPAEPVRVPAVSPGPATMTVKQRGPAKKKTLTVAQQAALLDRSPRQVARWRKDGSIDGRLAAVTGNGNGKAH
jgi:hypothetical protein